MNLETLVRQALRDLSEESRVPPGLADRALRSRRPRRLMTAGASVGAAALVTGVSLIVINLAAPDSPPPLNGQTSNPPLVQSGTGETDLRTDLKSSPPRRMVAGGHQALSAYTISQQRVESARRRYISRTWYLLDPGSRTYRKTPWAHLDVAPGLRRAAVLEGPLPARRVGLVDTTSGKVTRWIDLAQRAGSVTWSPEGSRLVVTYYADNPDLDPDQDMNSTGDWAQPGKRTGFSVIDLQSGGGPFRPLPGDSDDPDGRQDLTWSRDGRLIRDRTVTGKIRFYDPQGRPRTAPKNEGDFDQEAGVSPNGDLVAHGGEPPGPQTTVTDAATGRVAGVQAMEQLIAWADETHLIALDCGGVRDCAPKGEFYSRYVMVSVDGKKVVPLTTFQNSQARGAWWPLFTHR